MIIELLATPQVHRTVKKGLSKRVASDWNDLQARLRQDPWFAGADRRSIWVSKFPGLPNHRHADLAEAWRACWTIQKAADKVEVTVLFLGTHKQYDRLYGFATS